jgi:hypothetical protein
MIVRIWRTGLHEPRAADYERFALERSLPMFQRREACLGVLFTSVPDGRRAVVTLWDDAAAIERLDHDPEYRATVEAILSEGFLRPPQAVELLEVSLRWLREEVMTA